MGDNVKDTTHLEIWQDSEHNSLLSYQYSKQQNYLWAYTVARAVICVASAQR